MIRTSKWAAIALLIAGASLPASAAAREDKPFSLTLTASGEHDSNVSVEQTDTNARAGDSLAVLEADAKYTLKPDDKSSVTVGYDFEQSLHKRFGNFDMQTHTLSLGADRKLGGVTAAIDYSYMHVLLGGSGFLDMHMVSPSLSTFASKSVYLRASLTYTDKNFTTANAFDAKNWQGGPDVYYFFMQSKAYVSLTGRYEAEDARGPELTYKGFQLGANLQVPIATGKVRLGYAYRERHYDNVTAAIGARRRENRSVLKLGAEVPLVGQLRLKPEFRYIDRNSNYAPADYREYVETVGFSYEF